MSRSTKKAMVAGMAALALGVGVATTPPSAQAQVVYPHYGYYPAGSPHYGYRGYYGAYPAYGYARPRYYYPYYRRHRSNGGAVAAGLIGGLAIGALAASAARPAYASPANCWFERRRMRDAYGRAFIGRVRVCP